MKKNKVATSVTSGRAKVDRAETYPGGVKDEADGAQKADYRRYNSSVPRVGSGNSNSSGNSSNSSSSNSASGGNNVMKWFKYITDAAESYKSKDSTKSKKPVHQPIVEVQSSAGGRGGAEGGGGGGGGGRSTLYETTKSVANGSRREEVGDGEDRQGEDGGGGGAGGYIIHQQYPQQQQQQQHPAGHAWRRVEALQFEEDPVLVQPDEVKVSLTKVVDRGPSDTTTTMTTTPMSPMDMIKETNRVIEVTLAEKRNLVANILQIPFQSYDHICEVVDETSTSTDVRELMLSSLTQADLLTQLINEQLDAKLSVLQGSVDPRGPLTMFETEGSVRSPTKASLSRSAAIDQTPSTDVIQQQQLYDEGLDRQTTILRGVEGDLTIVVPCSRLMAISNRLHSNLRQLMELVESRDREMDSWETELSQCNDDMHLRHQPTSRRRHHGNGEYVTSSWEAVPVETEHLEVIEAEQIIEPERVVTLAPNLLPGSVTVTKMPGAKKMMPSSASDTHRHDS